MSHIVVLINEPDEYDRAVHGDDRLRSMPSADDLRLITKDAGTEGGRGIAVLTFTQEVDGRLCRAQISTTVRNLKFALRLIDAGYDDDGVPRPGTFGR